MAEDIKLTLPVVGTILDKMDEVHMAMPSKEKVLATSQMSKMRFVTSRSP